MSKQVKNRTTKQQKQASRTPQVDSEIREYLATVVPTDHEVDNLHIHFIRHIYQGLDAPLPDGYESQADARRLFHMILIAEWWMTLALEDMCVKFDKHEIDDKWLLEQAIAVYEDRGIYTIDDYDREDGQVGLFKLRDSGLEKWDNRARGADRDSDEDDEGVA